MDIPIYVINFNDIIRKNNMIKRFKSIELNLIFTDPVYITDSRLDFDNTTKVDPTKVDPTKVDKRTWAIMLQHLDSIRHFYNNTTYDYCIVCEDDILISKNFKTDLKDIINNFNKLDLDILLLGYLLPLKLHNNYFKVKKITGYNYHEYPDDLWGSQMYLINRRYANFLLTKYTIEFAINNLDKPYSPDWTITKNCNRAIIYPMLALEEGDNKSNNISQNDFHRKCFENNYDPDIYI